MTGRRWSPTFGQLFLMTLAGLALLLGVLFYIVLSNSRRSIMESGRRQREEAADRISGDVSRFLDVGLNSLQDLEREIQRGSVSVMDADALEKSLYNEIVNHDALSEITFTHADMLGFAPDGSARLAPGDRWQLSVFRARDGKRLITRRIHPGPGGFVADRRERAVDGPFSGTAMRSDVSTGLPDPTDHLTFQTPIDRGDYNTIDWTDLHRSQIDETVSESQRRPEVGVLRSVEDATGKFAGVIRVGLFADQLAQLVQVKQPDDPHEMVLCDPSGRLVAPVAKSDVLDDVGGDLRYESSAASPEVFAALALAKNVGSAGTGNGMIDVGKERYLITLRPLAHSQNWLVAVIGPQSYYLRGLVETRNRLLAGSLAVIALVLLGGFLTLHIMHDGLRRISASTAKMRELDFTAGPTRTQLRDVETVLESLEQGKTALRAMGKYVPIDLVRRLYRSNREPMLGGEPALVSIMFSDIRDFTTIAEKLDGNSLALALGRYFHVTTAAVHGNGGIVDKYIGDSLMALWNVPDARPDHAASACHAALDCLSAADRLFASAQWGGLAPFFTRIGLHTTEAIVGHFGAPDRMSYTALGDGVNTASRLEGLNKIYGTRIIASSAVREAAGERFCFRRLDVVTVKGRTHGVHIFELRGMTETNTPLVAAYEEALATYHAGDFSGAIRQFQPLAEIDPPSRVLLERCKELDVHPPPPGWDGVYVARTK